MSSLDPNDWPALRALAHQALDDAFDALHDIREREPWTAPPADVRAALRTAPIPRTPRDPAAVYVDFRAAIEPYAVDNRHPRFYGWVHGAGTPLGIITALLTAAQNANVGGRDHAAVEVERATLGWWRDIFGFPRGTTGVFTSGSSIANLIAVLVARHVADGELRAKGVGDARLVAYASREAHSSVKRALDFSGIGSANVRAIDIDAQRRCDPAALRAAIAQDRALGLEPFAIVATAGSASTGAVDDIAALADVARDERCWLHVDGAFGALLALVPERRALLDGLARADSLAFDLHKWMHVPYDVGCVLVRDGEAHRATFTEDAPYLQRAARGPAAGEPWFVDFGPELSRSFRALGVWFAMQTFGIDRLGAAVDASCWLAEHLTARVQSEPMLELLAPVPLQIVCFGYVHSDRRRADALNAAIVETLAVEGRAVVSTTTVDGRLAIRANVMNHRTSRADIDRLVDDVLVIGSRLLAGA